MDYHSFRRSYVTHLIEDGWDPRFVQEQVGHEHASTTSIHTCVSSDFRTRTLRRHLDATVAAALESHAGGVGMKRNVGYSWRLREAMAAHGVFTATELVPLLRDRGVDLSASQVHRLVSGTPSACRCRCWRRFATPRLHPGRSRGHHGRLARRAHLPDLPRQGPAGPRPLSRLRHGPRPARAAARRRCSDLPGLRGLHRLLPVHPLRP
ncbi:tyrosine-type recombinase/integrase [Streptomyces chryseus]|uniref:tyrosine-type recombinase/integrase n=1 Tax=Streptomyces chryseus TaxID=68186 RepID=UPI001E63046A